MLCAAPCHLRAPLQRQPQLPAPAAHQRHTARLHQQRGSLQVCQAAGQDDLDLAVFRFTLGIPGFDDALIPRVVGAAGVGMLVLNHVLSQDVSDAQVRAEALGAALAAVAIAAPSIEQRVLEAAPGRGRQAAAAALPGATTVFALQPDLPDAAKQELAWASYALLRNTNICGMAVVWEGRVVLARGLVGAAAAAGAGAGAQSGVGSGADKDKAAAAVLQAMSSSSGWVPAAVAAAGRGGALYCPDRGSMAAAGGADQWAVVPSGAASLLVQPLLPLGAGGAASSAPGGVLLLLAERPRALSSKERSWAAAVGAKLQAALAAAQ